nr:HAD-IA family hydrolase [uncultured Dyadobacter sp.]
MIRYVIFDFDGTLADSRAVFLSAYNELARKRGYTPIGAGDLQHLRTLTISDRCRHLGVPMYYIPFLAAEFLSLYKKQLHHIKLYEGIRELLDALRSRGIETAIISSNSESNITAFLSLNRIDSIRKIHCSRNLFGKEKLIRQFLKRYDLSAENILYVGDETRDIEACKKAGVKIAWVDWGYDSLQMVAPLEPDYIVSAPGEILTHAS